MYDRFRRDVRRVARVTCGRLAPTGVSNSAKLRFICIIEKEPDGGDRLKGQELSGSGPAGGGGAGGARALPGPLFRHPPRAPQPLHTHNCRSPARCPGAGPAAGAGSVVGAVGAGAGSPSGSEESNSPTELNSCRRLTDKPPLVKRLALGLAGALTPDDEDATPLVTDTTHSPSRCGVAGTSGGGYVNEAAGDAEMRTRRSNGELPRRGPRDARVPLDNRQAWCGPHSSGGSSSSGSSSCGSAHLIRSPNNNVPRPEPELKRAPWFQAGIPREIALEVLGGQPVGTFLVRSSSSQTDCYALSVRVPRDFQPTGIAHYLILRTPKGYKIKGFTKEFPSLSALVTHHSVMPELLPCPLLLARRAARAPRRDDLADPDCPALADFRRMMCELDV